MFHATGDEIIESITTVSNTNRINKIKNALKSIPIEQMLLMLSFSAIFLPFVITGIFAFVVTVFMLYKLWNKEFRTKLLSIKGVKPLAIFSVLIIIVPLFHQYWIGLAAGFLALMVIWYSVYSRMFITREIYNKMLDAACILSLICFIIACIQQILYLNKIPEYRSVSTFLNANYYGTIIEFVILACIYRISTNPSNRNFYISVIAVNIAGIFICDCMSSWLALFGGVLIMMLARKKYKLFCIILGITIGSVLVAFTIPDILPRIKLLAHSYEQRSGIWETARLGISENPLFGQGTLTYMNIYEKYGAYKTYHSHSLYLEPLLDFGIIGTGFLLAYLYPIYKVTVKNFFGHKNLRINALILGVTASIMIHGFTDATIFWLQTGMFALFIFSGVAIPAEDDKIKQ